MVFEKKKGKKNLLTSPENQASGSQRPSIVTTIVPWEQKVYA